MTIQTATPSKAFQNTVAHHFAAGIILFIACMGWMPAAVAAETTGMREVAVWPVDSDNSRPADGIQVAFRAVDFDTGMPIEGVQFTFGLTYFGQSVKETNVMTGTNGVALLQFSTVDLRHLAYKTQKTNYLSLQGDWFDQQISSLGKDFQVKLSQGVEIGGTMVDEAGKPISGAEVSFDSGLNLIMSQSDVYNLNWCPSAGTYLATTGPDGTWKARCIYPGVHWTSLRVHHSDFADTAGSTDITSAMEALGKGVRLKSEELREKKTRLTLTKGTSIKGRVVSATGAPVPGIKVNWAELTDRSYPDSLVGKQVVTTDADGKFQIPHAPLRHLYFYIQTRGYAPAAAELDPELPVSEVHLQAAPAVKCEGTVLDDQGKPISGARVKVIDNGPWRGLQWSTNTDSQGRFLWADAPSQSIRVEVAKDGFIAQSKTIQPGSETEFQLKRALRITGKVLDAKTKKPIDRFKIEWLDQNTPRNFEQGYRLPTVAGSNGVYTLDLGRLYAQTWSGGYAHSFIFRLRAPGYSPAVSDAYSSKTDAGDVSHDVELEPAAQLTGIVVDARGKPAAQAQVALESFKSSGSGQLLLAGKLVTGEFELSDNQGAFRLTLDPEATWVVAVHDRGFGKISIDENSTNVTVQLQPWGRIEGTVWEYDQLITNQEVWGMDAASSSSEPLRIEMRTNANAQGKFAFDHVPAGRYRIYRMIPMSNGGASGGATEVVEVQAGQTSVVKLGGKGRRVIGRFTNSIPSIPIDWTSQHYFPSARSVTPTPPKFSSNDEYEAWRNRPEIQRAFEKIQNYPIQFSADGSFHIDEMIPGEYEMNVNILDPTEPNALAYSKYIAKFSTTFKVPTPNESESRTAYDIGKFEITPNAPAVPIQAALKGKPLPDLTGFAPADAPTNKPILLLVVDAGQRPSRRALSQFTEQADVLKQKGIAVVVIQSGTMTDEEFARWKKESAPPFPVAKIDAAKLQTTWGASALPWLILTDPAHRVVAEGFAFDEINAKLKSQAPAKP